MTQSDAPPQLLVHDGSDSDETRKAEAREWAQRRPAVQLVGELIARLRGLSPEWWSPAVVRDLWPPLTRMRWFEGRPDIRQRITTALTGLPRNAARAKSCEFQAELFDSVMAAGDVDAAAFDAAFDPIEIATYADPAEIWDAFRERMPWGDDSPVQQRLVGSLLRSMLADRSSLDPALTRRPILGALDVRGAIDSSVWQSRIPLELRVAMDDARIAWERARGREPYQSRHDLQVVTPEAIPMYVPILDLLGVFQLAGEVMGFAAGSASTPRESGSHQVPRITLTTLTGGVSGPSKIRAA